MTWILLSALLAGGVDGVDFQADVLPILSDRCFPCHGPDPGPRKADLRLDRRDDALAASVIDLEHPEESELLFRIRSRLDDERMPPPGSHLKLSSTEIDTLVRWVRSGAEYQAHWAFTRLPEEVSPPRLGSPGRDPLDAFVRARLRDEGLSPSSEADPAMWLRRVTYDLTGLPPTPEECDGFLSRMDFEAEVDRLLTSPRFGERMAVPWLDAARYADSYGYQSDQLSPTWPWRDWVVRAFNDNLPYDQFLTWQLAGDLLPEATRDQRLATAFNRLHRMTNEGGSIEEEWREEYAADRVQTVGTAMLGLTVECARCHDHKFDPITQAEHYALVAYFDSIDEWGMYNDAARVPTPSLLLPTPEQEAREAELLGAIERASRTLEQVRHERESDFQAWLNGGPDPTSLLDPGSYHPLDAIDAERRLENRLAPGVPATTAPGNRTVPGHRGGALELVGDQDFSVPKVCGGLQPSDAFAVSCWCWVPEGEDGVIFHRSEGTDVGFHGTELVLRDGHLVFAIQRFWPGNAIAVRTKQDLPRERWFHLGVSYDGSISAGGMAIAIDGEVVSEVLRDHLFKSPGHGGHGLTFGHRFRTRTIAGLRLDELHTFEHELTPLEIQHLCDGHALTDAVANRAAPALREVYFGRVDAEVGAARLALRQARGALLEHRTGYREISVMEELSAPRPTYVLARGRYDAPRTDASRIDRGVPGMLASPGEPAPADRLELARWLTSNDHPLTARVAVNRLWQLFFGRGLVATSENFGVQGDRPSHPELLDYLAREFIRSGWDVKAMCRRIVLSSTYRQASAASAILLERDPHNRLLARGPSHRLTAEMIRDTALFAAGLLDERLGGPPVSPYQPAGLWREANSMSPAYRESVGGDLHRRSLYTVWKRTAPNPTLAAFDVPTRELCSARRSATSTPLQALVLLNDVQFVEACRVLAERTLAECSGDGARIDRMFRRLCTRGPTEAEARVLGNLLEGQRRLYAEAPDDARALGAMGERPAAEGVDPVEVAALTSVAQVILNLDGTVWKR